MIDFSQKLVDRNGDPIVDPASDRKLTDGDRLALENCIANGWKVASPERAHLILSTVTVRGLDSILPDEMSLPSEEKVKRYLLAGQILMQPQCELAPDVVALIKARIGRMYGPLIVGQAFEMLDKVR